jgi:DNA-binding CsgD family transcriptional regulator
MALVKVPSEDVGPGRLTFVSGDGLTIVTPSGRIVEWNDAAAEQLHLPREKAIGSVLADISRVPESSEVVWGHHITTLGAHLSGNPPVRHVLEARDFLDHPVRIHVTTLLVRSEQGQPLLIYSYTTEHLDADYQLRVQPPLGLTSREWEVVSLMMSGRSTKEIAQDLAIAYTTVRAHIRNILAALDASSRTQALMRMWSRFGTPAADT